MGSHQIKNHLPDGRTGLVALSFGMLADIADKSPRGFEILTLWRAGGLSPPTMLQLQLQPRHLQAVLPCRLAPLQGPREGPGPPRFGAVS